LIAITCLTVQMSDPVASNTQLPFLKFSNSITN